jgi:opacity protein-like surface antigen
MKKAAIVSAIAIIAFVLGAALATWWSSKQQARANTDSTTDSREVYIDTIAYYMPTPKDTLIRRYEVKTIPIFRTIEQTAQLDELAAIETPAADSITVAVPITQTMYADSAYTAWVSGYEARLDSIFVYPSREIVRIKHPPKRWSVGLQAGYGITPKGLQPYIGVGIACKILEF